jgi:hypothetical protein
LVIPLVAPEAGAGFEELGVEVAASVSIGDGIAIIAKLEEFNDGIR